MPRLVALLGALVVAWPLAARAGQNRYFNAAFTVTDNTVTFGQAPSWTHDGRVLSSRKDDAGVAQVYVSDLDGANETCLTCGLPDPNRYPLERPKKRDWILFCS